MRTCLAFLLLVFVVGCGASKTPPPVDTVGVPDDVPAVMTLTPQDWTEEVVNGKELYARSYRAGWEECLERHQRGELNLADESAEPIPMGEFGIQTRGRKAGFAACRRTLSR